MVTASSLLPSARTLSFDPGRDELVLHVSPRDRDLAAQVPGLKFYKPDETWRGKPFLSVGLACRGVFGSALEVDDSVYERLQPETDAAFAVSAVKNGEQVVPDYVHPCTEGLRDEQKDAAWLAFLRSSFLIGDEKGVGKTVEAAGALNIAADGGIEPYSSKSPVSPYPALVVATKSMAYTWAEELEKWCGVRVVVAGRTPTTRKAAIEAVRTGEAEVLVMCWEQLRLHSSLAPYGSVARTDVEKEPKELNAVPFRTVIADEVHKGANPKAKMTRALWAVGHAPSVVYRWALSATPVKGHTIDLWGPLHFIAPEEWPSRSKFIDRYVRTYVDVWGKMEDLGLRPDTEEEFRTIFESRYIRRPLRVNAQLLPVQYRFVDMEGKQRSVYKQFEKDSLVRVDGQYLVAVGGLTINTRLQQLAQATPVLEPFTDEDGNERTKVAALQLPSCKYDALCDLLDEMGDEPLVVFSDSRKLLELCHRELTTGKDARFTPEQVGLVIGGVTDVERHHWITQFQEGKLPLILCSIGAGSEGITLTRASTMCFLNRSYRQVGNNQAEGRLYRTGQERDVQIIDIIARESEELRVYEAITKKDARLQAVVRDEGWEERDVPSEEGH